MDLTFFKDSSLPRLNFRKITTGFPYSWTRSKREQVEESSKEGRNRTEGRADTGVGAIDLGLSAVSAMRKWVQLVLLAVGAILCTFGTITTVLWPSTYEMLVNMQLQLSKSSKSFGIWRDTPVPMSMKVYLFNWTNPQELETKEKPNFVEMGPYTFDEYHEKVNISFHDNYTVTFQQIRRWRFNPDRSNGSLDDMVTTLNVPTLTAAYVVRHWGFFMQTSLSYVLGRFKVSVTKSVRELLFDGYNDPLISLSGSLPALTNMKIPFDKFGWFYTRNGSDSFDGVFNMDTGADDINKLGKLREWNHRNRTNFYEGHCGDITGSAGELWPPHRKKDHISMFSSDLCRSIELPFDDEIEAVGIRGYRYMGGVGLVDNGTYDKSNECFCGGQCMPVGVANASSCRYGSPAFVSYPHFLNADPYYSSLVHGMDPDPEKHSFYITLEPNTGIPLDVAARLQINILMQPSKHIGLYQKVPTALFPMLWFEETARMTPEMAASLTLLLGMAEWGVYLCVAMLLAGIFLVLAVVVSYVVSRYCPRDAASKRNKEMISQPATISSDICKPMVTFDSGGGRSGTPTTPPRAPFAEAEDTGDVDFGDHSDEMSALNGRKSSHHNGVYPSFAS